MMFYNDKTTKETIDLFSDNDNDDDNNDTKVVVSNQKNDEFDENGIKIVCITDERQVRECIHNHMYQHNMLYYVIDDNNDGVASSSPNNAITVLASSVHDVKSVAHFSYFIIAVENNVGKQFPVTVNWQKAFAATGNKAPTYIVYACAYCGELKPSNTVKLNEQCNICGDCYCAACASRECVEDDDQELEEVVCNECVRINKE